MSETILYDENQIKKDYEGLTPHQLIDFKGLVGDPSDNIPGVKGVGEKTALALLKEFGSLEKVYEAVEKESKKIKASVFQKLKVSKDNAFFSRKLSLIDTDVDIDFRTEESIFGRFDQNEVVKIFQKFGFSSLISRLPENKTMLQATGKTDTEEKITFQKVSSQNIQEALNLLHKAKNLVLVYSAGNSLFPSLLISDTKKAFYFTQEHFQSLAGILASPKILKIGHDLKSVIKNLAQFEIRPQGLEFDTMIASYLLLPGERNYSLEKIVFREFGELEPENLKETEKFVWQARQIQELVPKLEAKMKAAGIFEVFKSIEMPLIPILAKMELQGIKLNTKVLTQITQILSKELEKLEKQIYKLAGEEFNINSPQQLADVLFGKLKIPGTLKGGRVKRTAGGAASTEAGELLKLQNQHPIIRGILKYRELAKLKSTYTEALPRLVANDGRIHSTFNQTGTATGRLSSQDPNLQNIPAGAPWGGKIRSAFEVGAGFKIVSIDYSQLELRVVAALAGDEKMVNAFKKGLDIHQWTAANVNNVSLEKVTPEMRRRAKELNFGIIYGMGAQSFAESSGISKDEAQQFIREYFNDFQGIAQYLEKTKELARQQGFVTTYFGRRRYLPEIYSLNQQLISQAERMAINFPVQGTAADIVKKAMITVSDWIEKENFSGEIHLLLQVHDELVFEVKGSLIQKTVPKLMKIMEEVVKFKVPIIVEASVGNNWGNLKKV